MSLWFRMYESTLDDPKVQKLKPELFKAWVNLLALASRYGGTLPSITDCAFALRVSEDKAGSWLLDLNAAGLMDKTETGYVPHNWHSRQFKSDVSNERVKRHRERQRNAECNVTETPSEQIRADTETEQRDSNAPKAHCLPHDWKPSEEGRAYALSRHLNPDRVSEAFVDYWTGGKGAKQRRTDWDRTWRVWCDRETPKAGATPNVVRFNG